MNTEIYFELGRVMTKGKPVHKLKCMSGMLQLAQHNIDNNNVA